jgi:hypothetical protein
VRTALQLLQQGHKLQATPPGPRLLRPRLLCLRLLCLRLLCLLLLRLLLPRRLLLPLRLPLRLGRFADGSE